MIKHFKYIVQGLFCLLVLCCIHTACSDEAIVQPTKNWIDENGNVHLTIHTEIPTWTRTRAVNPSGNIITSVSLLCFNENGMMIELVRLDEDKFTHVGYGNTTNNGEQSGTFDATISSRTRIIHLIANYRREGIEEINFIGMHENEAVGRLVSSSGKLVYWGRMEFADQNALENWDTNTNPIILYRNQAVVMHAVNTAGLPQNTQLEVLGTAICNQYAFGTVAPFNPDAENPFDFSKQDFATIPPAEYDVARTDPTQTDTWSTIPGDPRYFFEDPNVINDEVYMIYKIKKTVTGTNSSESTKYYKIMLLDGAKDPMPVIRNHLYTVTFSDINENYGVDNFEDAKNATPANAPMIMVSDEVPEVSRLQGNNVYTLSIDKGTVQVAQQAGEFVINYSYNGTEQPNLQWLSNDDVADEISDANHTWVDGKGSIKLNMHTPTQEVRRGVLLLKEKNGPLYRRITVILAPKFSFGPVWVSSEIPMVTGEPITVLFNVPDNYPEELLPSLEVKFSSNLIDARPSNDQKLKVITEKTEFTGIKVLADPTNPDNHTWQLINTDGKVTEPWNYKYVVEDDNVRQPGRHRVVFRTLLDGSDFAALNEKGFHIYLEDGNNYFNTEDLYIHFQTNKEGTIKGNQRILLNNGMESENFLLQEAVNYDPVVGEQIDVTFSLGSVEESEENGETNKTIKPATDKTKMPQMRVFFDANLLEPVGGWATNADIKTGLFGNNFIEFQPTAAFEQTISFKIISAQFDSYIVLSAKGKIGYSNMYDNSGINEELDDTYQSACVVVKSTGRQLFEPRIGQLDNNSFAPYTDNILPYGLNKPVVIEVNNLKLIGKHENHDHSYCIELGTKNLKPQDNSEYIFTQWENKAGYTIQIPASETGDKLYLKMVTNDIVSAETLTFASSNAVAFKNAELTFSNAVMEGTLRLSDNGVFVGPQPFVALQRSSDHTYVGSLNCISLGTDNSSGTFNWILDNEYKLEENTNLTITYSSTDDGSLYVKELTMKELLNILQTSDGAIDLKKQASN